MASRLTFLLLLVLIFVGGCTFGRYFQSEKIITLAWDDQPTPISKYGPGFYGALVTAMPEGGKLSVRCQVLIGPQCPNDFEGYIHDSGEIARVADLQEVIARYGKIVWKPDGVHIGDYFLDRKTIQTHR